jgi:hypothetical protein
VIASCNKDNSNNFDNNNLIKLDSFIVNNYRQDAKRLYFHEIISNSGHPNFNHPILDTGEVTKILKIIQAVYNLKTPETDTIFKLYKIHGYYCYDFQSISLKVKTDLTEIKNLSKGLTDY